MITQKIGRQMGKQLIAAGLIISLAMTGGGVHEAVYAEEETNTNELVLDDGTVITVEDGSTEESQNSDAQAGESSGDQATLIERAPIEMVYVHGEKRITVGGKVQSLTRALPVVNGATMFPVQTIARAIGADVYNDKKGTHIDTYRNKVTFNVNMKGVNHNGSYVLMSNPAVRLNNTMHIPLSALKQIWGGSYTFDPDLGLLHISIPREPNFAPTAGFTISSLEVKQGEPVFYEDLSYDTDGEIVKTEWSGRKDAYFESGVYTITQTVIDNDGARSAVKTQELVVTDEVMYTPFEYYMRYGNPGDKFEVDGRLMNTYDEVDVKETRGGRMLYMSNAPERFFGEGLLYEAVLNGESRLFVHHRNGAGERMKLAVVATNEQSVPVKLVLGKRGLGGPSVNALQFGSAAVLRYFGEAAPIEMVIEPGQSVLLLPELETRIMNDGDGFSAMLDIDSNDPLTFTTMALRESTNPLDVVFDLPLLEKVGNRGTFADMDWLFEVNEEIGLTEGKLRLGSRGGNITGVDALTGNATVDGGEYGVVTTIKLKNVAYGTRIILNPRAGNYQGAVVVNGKVFAAPTGGHVAPGQAILLYHQEKPEAGANGELPAPPEVTIAFSSPGASALPVMLVFFPGSNFE